MGLAHSTRVEGHAPATYHPSTLSQHRQHGDNHEGINKCVHGLH